MLLGFLLTFLYGLECFLKVLLFGTLWQMFQELVQFPLATTKGELKTAC
jgi:hypothetical protein